MSGMGAMTKDTMIVRSFIYAFLVLGAVTMALPYVWMFVTSIKPLAEIQAFPPSFVVKHPTIEPYTDLFKMVPMFRYLWNSLFVAGCITLFMVFATSLAGYAFAKHKFWGRDQLFFVFLASLMIPWQVNIIPGFVIVKNLGWLNTYQGLIIPSMACCAFGIFLNRQYIYSISDDLIDAARIDGCGEFTIYRLVILPLIKPVLATLAIFTFLQQWNNFVWPLVIIHTSDMRTIPLGLAVLTGQFGANYGMIMAGAVVSTLPMLAVYILFQKYIIKGIPHRVNKDDKIMDPRKIFVLAAALLISATIYGCAPKEAPKNGQPDAAESSAPLAAGEGAFAKAQEVKVDPNDPLYYLKVSEAKVSSFDQTPDWAPEPDPKALIDGDMLTRWASNYDDTPQWVVVDLGVKSVVNNMVIKWERAYAPKYQVLVSDDAAAWKEVYVEKDFKGGTADINFPAASCRYAKVIGLEKVDPNWGISIWEIEVYGPKSLNPSAAVSKKDYTNKDQDEARKKEAEELVAAQSAPLLPLDNKPFQQGVVYTSWTADELLMPASDFTLVKIKKTGYDAVAIMIPAYQEALQSDNIYLNDGPGGDTPNIESIKHAIDTCHKIGLRVMLKPHIDPRTDEARINIIASDKWFDSYEKIAVKYAQLSQEKGVEIFAVGTELEGTTFDAWTKRWKQVIDKVKEVYKGKLIYCANWTEYKEVPFWQDMDYIGIDAYFPLSSSDDPTKEDLVAAWTKVAAEIDAWLKEKGLSDKGVILSEIGYTSSDGTSRQPWAAMSSKEDQDEQAACLDATFEVMSKNPWFRGYYLWQYMPQERWSPLGFTIDGKKAEDIVKGWINKFKERDVK